IVTHKVLSTFIVYIHLSERLEEFKTEAFDFKTRASYVTAKLFFLGNMIKHNTNSSKELIRSLKNDKSVLAMIPHKELFNRSTLDKKSLSYMMSDKELYSRDSKFFKEIDFTFRKITDKL
ncbi:ParA family protein, partial [Streptococcus agalactiae]|nr:ParA family protein [Streptococcus agalactiae]